MDGYAVRGDYKEVSTESGSDRVTVEKDGSADRAQRFVRAPQIVTRQFVVKRNAGARWRC